MQFNRIRLSGFKSFVDPTELLIEDGLTGVVGPNGCGKSNLLEAIRWVMGENSAKSMRGKGMDDVIFSGTERRPARNLADVTLALTNDKRDAPAAFNDSDAIEVTRRIERDSGSAYRINSCEVRAKDVQLLFADAATGAHSPALVSQGRIGSLISAKPQDRRAVLEEAAGIMGLHKRRAEAESRLRGAENNLLRLDDVMLQMDAQMGSLKRQARQATRFRNISGDLRRAEATLLFLRWQAASEALLTHQSDLQKAEVEVSEITRVATQFTTEQTDLSAVLPELRQKEAETGAAVHRLTVARENLDAEEARLTEQKAELDGRIEQIRIDLERETEFMADARSALEKLANEAAALSGQNGDGDGGDGTDGSGGEDEAEQEAVAAETLDAANKAASEAEERFDALSTRMAEERARNDSLGLDLRTTAARIERLEGELAEIKERRAASEGDDEQSRAVNDAEEAVASAEKALNDVQDDLVGAEAARLEAQDQREAARRELAEKSNALGAIDAEIRALDDVLATSDLDDGKPISADIKVDPGYEAAVGAALGDDLNAPEADSGLVGWQTLPPLPSDQALPDGATTLADFIKAPKALARRLSQVGIVSAADGAKLAEQLLPGQRLVTRGGALWRWDGFFTGADAPSAQAAKLAQKNRLAELSKERKKSEAAVAKAEGAAQDVQANVDAAALEEQNQRARRGEAERSLGSARQALGKLSDADSARIGELAAMAEAESRIGGDLTESRSRLADIEKAIAQMPAPDAHATEMEAAKKTVETLRSQLADARASFDSLHRINEERRTRLATIQSDKEAWSTRVGRATEQTSELEARREEAVSRLEGIADTPAEMEQRRIALLDQISKAENVRTKAADALAQADNMLAEKDRELRSAQGKLAEARERRIRAEAGCENIEERRGEIAHDIAEKFECTPPAVLETAGVSEKDQGDLPEPEVVEKKLDRLKAERERLGAVNLRADQEMEEIREQLEHLESEKSDLESAIARLRQGIGSLNREGRERVLAAFKEVDAHFSRLFTTLFGGGHAHLALTESDDPLEAGLEIMASPPGKKLQSLSLLSGGEQALTAVSLIFAVFMTNPAPICVLDEVDAPLDDANVERFCDLLEEIVRETNTRFLIVTHNAVTMSRMNRLFGITMSERGVSQLVSVDLEQAEELQAVG